MKITNTRVIGVCLIVASSFFVASSSQADSTTFNACVKKSNGAVRIISGKMKCAKSESLVSWKSTNDNLVGAAGVAGAKGDTGSVGSAGATGPAGATGAAGTNGVDGVNGTNGLNGTNGTNGVNGISKALIASGTQTSINQGSSGTVITANVPAGKYAMSLAAALSYSNASTNMLGYAVLDCFVTSSSSYVGALTTAASNFWPILGIVSPNKTTFEAQNSSGDEIMRRSFAGNGILELASATTLKLICKHYSSVSDDSAQKVTFYNPRLILTAVDEISTM